MPAPKGHPNYNTDGLGGAKTKYTDEFIEGENLALIEWMKKKSNMFIEDFCFERGYLSKRLLEWTKKNENILATYDMFRERQRTILFKGGLSKQFAHPMCALILSHSHQVNAEQKHVISNDPNNPVPNWLAQSNGKSKDLVNDE